MAIRQRRLAGEVAGYVRRAAAVAECRRLGAVDIAMRDLRKAVSGADFIVLCTPIGQMRSLLERMRPALSPGAIITDVGSVKTSVIHDLERRAKSAGARFVGSHPMAGSEQTGVAAGRADLFEGAVCAVTPTPRSDAGALRKVEAFWKSLGGCVLRLTPQAHDALVSRSSHLPQVAAVTLSNLVLGPSSPAHQSDLCANGFRDATRMASGSAEMWRDIALANRKHLARALDEFIQELLRFRKALDDSDVRGIARRLRTARKRREKWSRTVKAETRAGRKCCRT